MSTVRPISTKEVAVSAEEIKGLCATCNAASSCAIRIDSVKPIWFCEEFDNYVVVADRTPKQAPPRHEAAAKPNGGAEGLCSNCATRQSCSYRTPGAEIWFCEDYS